VCDLIQKIVFGRKIQLLDIMGIFHDNCKARSRLHEQKMTSHIILEFIR
jgi:hypothetical protein